MRSAASPAASTPPMSGLARQLVDHHVEDRTRRQGSARVIEVQNVGDAGRVRSEQRHVERHVLNGRLLSVRFTRPEVSPDISPHSDMNKVKSNLALRSHQYSGSPEVTAHFKGQL